MQFLRVQTVRTWLLEVATSWRITWYSYYGEVIGWWEHQLQVSLNDRVAVWSRVNLRSQSGWLAFLAGVIGEQTLK